MPYQPYTLPQLPRLRCPFECIYPDRRSNGDLIKIRVCCEPALGHGWCRNHGYVVEVLELASRLCYPELAVNEHLIIGRGIANWEGYCVRMPFDRSIEIKMSLARYQQEQALFRARIRKNGHVSNGESPRILALKIES